MARILDISLISKLLPKLNFSTNLRAELEKKITSEFFSFIFI